MNTSWNVSGNIYTTSRGNVSQTKLPFAVFEMAFHPDTGIYLEHIQDRFPLPKKMYGINSSIIDRVINTYQSTNKNLGVLFNGIKGTGKTIAAKKIANSLGIPVIMINSEFKNINIQGFISNINQDVVVFVDEYEKIFEPKDSRLLSLMDGVLDTGYRRVFLFTTNEPTIHSAMVSRPSRIRYCKNFGNLGIDTINEIVDDFLVHKELKDKTVAFIKKMKEITVDNIVQVVAEVNIYKEDPMLFKDIFNISIINNIYDIFLNEYEDMPEKERGTGVFAKKIYSGIKIPDYILEDIIESFETQSDLGGEYWMRIRAANGSDSPSYIHGDQAVVRIRRVLSMEKDYGDFEILGYWDKNHDKIDKEEEELVPAKFTLRKKLVENSSVTKVVTYKATS